MAYGQQLCDPLFQGSNQLAVPLLVPGMCGVWEMLVLGGVWQVQSEPYSH